MRCDGGSVNRFTHEAHEPRLHRMILDRPDVAIGGVTFCVNRLLTSADCSGAFASTQRKAEGLTMPANNSFNIRSRSQDGSQARLKASFEPLIDIVIPDSEWVASVHR
jgi:hypothetical protein